MTTYENVKEHIQNVATYLYPYFELKSMSVAERTIYVGSLFLVFTYFSPEPHIGSFGFAMVLISAFGSASVIRDSASKFDYEFKNFFYVFLTLSVIYSIFAHHVSDGFVSALWILAVISILSLASHGIASRPSSDREFFDITDIHNSDSGSDGDGSADPDSVEEQAEEYVGGDGSSAEAEAENGRQETRED